MSDLVLASVFPPADAAQWRGLVDKVLKGADFDKALTGLTADGIRVAPLYPKAEGPVPILRPAARPWRVAVRVDHPDPAAANSLLLDELDGGADAVTLTFAGAATARGFGLPLDATALDRALDGVMLDLVALRIEGGPEGAAAARLLLDALDRRGHALAEIDLDLGLDPIGAAAAAGRSTPALTAALLDRLAGRGFGIRLMLADGRPYHEAGASQAQELAAVLATGLAYLRDLESLGFDIDAARDALSFLLVADPDEFLTIAKLRAVRRLWARIEAACGLEPRPLRLHAETAWRSATRRDPWTNILRDTVAAFSAGIGGADSLTVLPFTSALGLPDAFARRVARNTQLILLDEANLWRVADPVAGAGGFEALTEALEEKAWALLQEIEREGGIRASLASGALPGRIASLRAVAERAAATRRAPITGTSEFPHLAEAPVAVLMERDETERSGPLPSVRLSEPYERLRDAAEARLAETGARPRIFLACLGPLSAFTARSTFARNLFEAGGIEAVGSDASGESDDLAAAFAASGARIACLCSSDAVYESEAAPAAVALKAAGARAIYLAGRPGEREAALRDAGVTGFVSLGADLPRLLAVAQEEARP